MESTGVYWIPVWNILERPKCGLQLMLAAAKVFFTNPRRIRLRCRGISLLQARLFVKSTISVRIISAML